MLYPLVFDPILAPKPWGGRRLSAYGKKLPESTLIGESWELADLATGEFETVSDGQSRVSDGPLAGRTLRSLVAEYGPELLGDARPVADGFPLLIKLLDAHQRLSVQVHPTAEYVSRHPDTHLKTETWYVVEAEPDAVIYKGFVPDTTREDVARRAGSPDLIDLLVAVPVRAGDTHHLPAGTVHALGAGVMVAEVQTPSDTTFRLYDWTEEYDRPLRRLHVDEALACLRFAPAPHTEPTQIDPTRRTLVENPEYWIREHRSEGGTLLLDRSPGPRILMVLSGSISVGHLGASRGTTVLIPASVSARVKSKAPVVVLEIRPT